MDDNYDAVEHRKLVFAHFGAAIYFANVFEHGIANALMFGSFLTKTRESIKKAGIQNFDRKKYESEFDAFFDDQFSQTMGNLLKRLSAAVELDQEFRAQIIKAKERRDFLSHHFFRERVEELMTRSGLDKMIAELEEDQALFRLVDKNLEIAMQPVRKRLGIKDEWFEAATEKELERLRRGESSLD